MDNSAKQIWLDKELYPLYQQSEKTYFDGLNEDYKSDK